MEWEGSRSYGAAVALASAIVNRPAETMTPEEHVIGRAMGGMLRSARPVVCPPEQLEAVSDDVFEDLGQAFEYAAAARLRFEATFFDFVDPLGNAPDMGFHMVNGGGYGLGFELRAVVAGEIPAERRTVFLPIVGQRNQPAEELGAAFVEWDPEGGASEKPHRWRETFPASGGRQLALTLMSVSAAMDALDEQPRGVAGGLLGCIRADHGGQENTALQTALATVTASAVRRSLKLLYLLDSANVGLAPVAVSRQVRRRVARAGSQIAWTVSVAPTQQPRADTSGEREYSHRFEVRGNFAHHREGSRLFDHSAPEEIRACPRCGRCRRVWRPSHVKGPPDQPLAIKIRRVDFGT